MAEEGDRMPALTVTAAMAAAQAVIAGAQAAVLVSNVCLTQLDLLEGVERTARPCPRDPQLWMDAMDDWEFVRQFRVSRTLFGIIASAIRGEACFRRCKLSVEVQVMLALYHLAQGSAATVVAGMFGIAHTTVIRVTIRVAATIVRYFGDAIKWPSTAAEFKSIADGFEAVCGLPGIAGAVDGSFIPLHPSKRMGKKYLYKCRKGYYATVLQAACDSTCRFLAVDAGWAGTMNDASIFQQTWGGDLEHLVLEGYVLLGDGAYPLSAKLIKPYNATQRASHHMRYNYLLSRGRGRIEIAFSHLKNTWRFLGCGGFVVRDVAEHTQLVLCCCIVHNLLISIDGHSVDPSPSAPSPYPLPAFSNAVVGLQRHGPAAEESDGEVTDASTRALAAGPTPAGHRYAPRTHSARAEVRASGEAVRSAYNIKAETLMTYRWDLWELYIGKYAIRYSLVRKREREALAPLIH